MSFTWTETLYPFGSGSNPQAQPFATGMTPLIPVDGTATEVVTFPVASSNIPLGVVVTPAPGTPQNQQLSYQVTAVTVNGFSLTCYGGLTGNSIPFFYIALLVETPNFRGGPTGSVATNGGSIAVTFDTPFPLETTAVAVSPNPATPTNEELSWEITNITSAGFTLTCYGGSGGMMPFNYIASGN
jgi:hypothetical protein